MLRRILYDGNTEDRHRCASEREPSIMADGSKRPGREGVIMAYISRECVNCKDKTKRCAGEYHGKDESGKRFRGHMFLCSNETCEIYHARQRAKKEARRNG